MKSVAAESQKQPRDTLAGELIGLRVKVAASSCKDLMGIQGKIVDETRNTFLVQTSTGTKRVPKAACEFLFPDAGFTVEGRKLVCRPEDRTKKLVRRH